MSDYMVTLESGALVRILEEWRCPKCGDWIGEATVGHSSFSRMAAGAGICMGRSGTGRKRTTFWSAMPTEKQRTQIAQHYDGHPEFYPLLKWRRATATEKAEALKVGVPAPQERPQL